MWSVDRSVETGYVRRKSGEKELFQMERPNEQTGKPTKPPPLSQGLSSTGIAIPHDAQPDVLAKQGRQRCCPTGKQIEVVLQDEE